MKTSKPKIYIIIKRTTTLGNGVQTVAYEAYKNTFLVRCGIYIYADYVMFTRSNTYEECKDALNAEISTEVIDVESIVEIG